MTDPLDLLNRLDGIRAETLKRLDPLTQAQLDWRPPNTNGEAAWSLGEVFLHIALDEHYLREQIARPLLEGLKPPDSIRFIPPPPAYALKKEAIAFWFERARVLTRRMVEALPTAVNLELKHEGGIEPMNGLEWLAAYGTHEAFHHRQIDVLVESAPATIEARESPPVKAARMPHLH